MPAVHAPCIICHDGVNNGQPECIGLLEGLHMTMSPKSFRELKTLEALKDAWPDLSSVVLIDLKLAGYGIPEWREAKIDNTFFLGCQFDSFDSQILLEQRKAVVLPPFTGLPYDPFRYRLYTPAELQVKAASGVTLDQAIYCDYIAKGKWSADLIEALCRRIHDDGIDDALGHLIEKIGSEKFIGFMGGSSNKRSDLFYKKTAETARLLTREGFFVVSGGGPGMMEAANLGAYLASHPDSALDSALGILKQVDGYTDLGKWIATASEVKSKFPNGADSLGIPTWFYGFEPTNMFSTHVAKYFDNSIREGGLVQIGKRAIIFAPGSAGTRQEIFMDAAQNNYGTTGQFTPMIFLGKQQYAVDTPVYPLIQMLATGSYKDLLLIADEASDVVAFINGHNPVPKAKAKDPICGFVPKD
jgi:predicted Rossmann-fold nucleotide-binding protein